MNELVRLYKYFTPNFVRYNQIKELNNANDVLWNAKRQLEAKHRSLKRVAGSVIPGCILLGLSFINALLVAGVLTLIHQPILEAFDFRTYEDSWEYMMGGGVGGCILAQFIIGLILLILVTPLKRAKGERIYKTQIIPAIKENDRLRDENRGMVRKLEKEIEDHYNNCPNCTLGLDFTTEYMLKKLYSYIEIGEAETIKEAIQRYQLHQHENQMLKKTEETRQLAMEAKWEAQRASAEASAASAAASAAREEAASAAFYSRGW